MSRNPSRVDLFKIFNLTSRSVDSKIEDVSENWEKRRNALYSAISQSLRKTVKKGDITVLGLLNSLHKDNPYNEELMRMLLEIPGATDENMVINGPYSKIFLMQLSYTLGDESVS